MIPSLRDRQTSRRKNRQTDRQTDKLTDTQTDTKTDMGCKGANNIHKRKRNEWGKEKKIEIRHTDN